MFQTATLVQLALLYSFLNTRMMVLLLFQHLLRFNLKTFCHCDTEVLLQTIMQGGTTSKPILHAPNTEIIMNVMTIT